jgi:DNA-binding NarL/FixJ family response regulator
MNTGTSTDRLTVTRILLVDDQSVVRSCIRRIVETQADMVVVAEAEGGHIAMKLAIELQPDVILMDITMPGLNGIEATRAILDEGSTAKIVVLSLHSDVQMVREVLRAGAHAYVVKNRVARELHSAVRAVLAGETFVSSDEAFTV